MAASILSIGTALPRTRLGQTQLRELFAAQPTFDRLTQRLVRAAFDASAIDHRHTVLDGLLDASAGLGELRMRDDDGTLRSPGTAARNDAFRRLAPPLFAEAARAALEDAAIGAGDVTDVVTVSCTGLVAPGPDYHLVRDLGMSPAVARYHLGFVGCAAALPALRMAARICGDRPDAVVLVACAELCSLHLRVSPDPQQIVSASVFADGAAAAVVTGRATGRRLELGHFATALTADGADDMVWSVGDEGFDMILTPEVPRIVGREIRSAVVQAFGDDVAPIDTWAVHPGGRSVLDRIEDSLGLDSKALRRSREVLRDYGNMSSATILFILRAILHDAELADHDRVAALAFGPGLTVESALLTVRDAA